MRIICRFAFAISCWLVLAGAAAADQEAGNRAHVAVGAYGRCYAKSVPDDTYVDRHRGRTRLYRVTRQDDELLAELDWFAQRIHLDCNVCADAGSCGISVVRLGPWHRGFKASGDELAIAFYLNDRLLGRYSTLDIAGRAENVSRSVSHYTVFERIVGFKHARTDRVHFVVTTHDGRTLTFDAGDGRMVDIAKNTAPEKQLFQAIEAGDRARVAKALEGGLDGNVRFADVYHRRFGWHALDFAVHHNKPNIAELLLENGAEIDAATRDGTTALARAVARGNLKLIEFLLARGADPMVRLRHETNTLLHTIGGRHNGVAIAGLLVAHGADIRARDAYGNTPLHDAASGYQGTALVGFLLAAGVERDGTNDFGATALHQAARYGRAGTVRLLLRHGARRDIADRDGKTARDYWLARGMPSDPFR